MHRLFSSRTQSLFTAVVLSAAFVVAMYMVQGERAKAALPSAKAAVAVGQILDLEALALSPDESTVPATSTTGWRNVMRTAIHVNSQGDLAMDLSMQCALVTDTTVKSLNGIEDISEAQAGIRFRIALYQWTDSGALGAFVKYAEPNNEVVPYPTNLDTQTNRDGVTYCDRYQMLRAKFSGLNCTANLTTGVVTCATPEELQLILSTLDAHSFNFFAIDLASGRYWVVVEGKADAAALDQAGAKAMAGLGSLFVEKVRLVKGAELTTGIPID